MELTGEGMNDKMTSMMKPSQARSDAEVMRAVEIWEDEYNDAVLRGMPRLEDPFKISILRSFIATDKIKEKMETEIYLTYNEAKTEMLRWARAKAQRASEIE